MHDGVNETGKAERFNECTEAKEVVSRSPCVWDSVVNIGRVTRGNPTSPVCQIGWGNEACSDIARRLQPGWLKLKPAFQTGTRIVAKLPDAMKLHPQQQVLPYDAMRHQRDTTKQVSAREVFVSRVPGVSKHLYHRRRQIGTIGLLEIVFRSVPYAYCLLRFSFIPSYLTCILNAPPDHLLVIGLNGISEACDLIISVVA
jgi:hypothetical protein